MTKYQSELDLLFASLNQETEKVAQANEHLSDDEAIVKIAQDLYAGGEIMASGFIDSILEKLAGSGVPAGGGGSANPINSPRSKWESIAAAIAARHGRSMSPGDDTSVRAEATGYKGGGSDRAISGAVKGSLNPQKSLG